MGGWGRGGRVEREDAETEADEAAVAVGGVPDFLLFLLVGGWRGG